MAAKMMVMVIMVVMMMVVMVMGDGAHFHGVGIGPPVVHAHAAAPVHHHAPIPYDFGYGVSDHYTGNDFGHTENSDGNVVKGTYYVLLPDGRKQIVTYTADHYNGYQAHVSYEGTAHYPDVHAGVGGGYHG